MSKKHDINTLNSFWSFVESVNYNSNTSDAESVRKDFLKKISPYIAESYKEICDELAYSLYRKVTDKNVPLYLYSAYEAIAKGKEFFELCLQKPETVVQLSSTIDALNHFGNCLPTEDDYFAQEPVESYASSFDEEEEF